MLEAFPPTGIFMGLGLVPWNLITTAGKADTTTQPTYPPTNSPKTHTSEEPYHFRSTTFSVIKAESATTEYTLAAASASTHGWT